MRDFDLYMDRSKAIQDALLDEINAYIRFEIHGRVDMVSFKIQFKGFIFVYDIDRFKERMMEGETANEMAYDILTAYKAAVLGAFFKTEERKKRDEYKKLGIPYETEVGVYDR